MSRPRRRSRTTARRAYASARMSMASCALSAEPQVQRQSRDQALHGVLDVLGRDPLPRPDQRVPGLLPHVGQVHRVDPVRHAARRSPCTAVSPRRSRTPASPGPSRPAPRPPAGGAADRRAAASSPAAAYFLTWLIAAGLVPRGPVQQPLRPAGVRSPACSAIVQPFRDGSSLTSADTYFPACSHVCVRTKHDRSSPIRADRSRTARRAPILAAAAALSSFVVTNT